MLLIDLLIPDLLWPRDDAPDVMRSPGAPTLERWLARGTSTRAPPVTREQWLWDRFVAPAAGGGSLDAGSDALAVAPVTLSADGGHPDGRWWMRADPVHFIVGRTGLRLAPLDTLDLSPAEGAALAASISSHFQDPKFALLAPNAQRWYLGSDAPFELRTTPPERAVGHDVDSGLPQGPDRRAWMSFINEVQMLWFEHPVNVERERRRGLPVVSSLWLHGAGRMPAPGTPKHDHTAGGGALLAGLAALTGRPHSALDAGAPDWLAGNPRGRWLVVLDTLARCAETGDAFAWREALVALERDWFDPLDRALRAGQLAQLNLIHPAADRLRTTCISATDRFRFWRASRPLATHA